MAYNAVDFLYPLVDAGKRSDGTYVVGRHDTALVRVFLDVDDRVCRHCGAKMHVCDHRRYRIETLEGQRKIVCRLVKCIDRTCPGNHRTVSPESEAAICLPRSIFGWDVFCWIGHRRFSRHWSVPQIRGELQDGYKLSTWGGVHPHSRIHLPEADMLGPVGAKRGFSGLERSWSVGPTRRHCLPRAKCNFAASNPSK